MVKIRYFEVGILLSRIWRQFLFISGISEREKLQSLAAQGRVKIVCIEGKTKLSGESCTRDEWIQAFYWKMVGKAFCKNVGKTKCNWSHISLLLQTVFYRFQMCISKNQQTVFVRWGRVRVASESEYWLFIGKWGRLFQEWQRKPNAPKSSVKVKFSTHFRNTTAKYLKTNETQSLQS